MGTDFPSPRSVSREDARGLKPGDEHYLAYVGPPKEYDFMGATQFRLLTSLGLREHHRVLDFGCGSLRAGRLLIPYLLPRHYFGIEPNSWLVDDAVERQLGRDIIGIKQPSFDGNVDFRSDVFDVEFDFIVAQSIFSHTTADLAKRALRNFHGCLASGGLVACTFVVVETTQSHAGDGGWVYPECVAFSESDVLSFFSEAGLSACRLSWYHPRQTWFLAARHPDDLPCREELELLNGSVLRDPEFRASIKASK